MSFPVPDDMMDKAAVNISEPEREAGYRMKALILNSGLGSRMGELTKEHPKCMTEIAPGETIVSRQLRLLYGAGVKEIVMTTGVFEEVLQGHCASLGLPLEIKYVLNPRCRETNYIYSIYCAREVLRDDVILMHGDLVFEESVLAAMLAYPDSCMAVSSSVPLPEKDFKAVLDGEGTGDVTGRRIRKVGVRFFAHAVAAQPLYVLKRESWEKWLSEIVAFCERGETGVYAEDAMNVLDGTAGIRALDIGGKLCAEIDNSEDLESVVRTLAHSI